MNFNIWKILAILFALIILGAVLRIVCFPIDTISKGLGIAEDVRDKTLTGSNAIYNYEWFKMQEASIKQLVEQETRAITAAKNLKESLPNDRSKWDWVDKNEYDRLGQVATGIGMQIDKAIAEYNAKSSMVNRNIFKDNLPTNLTRGFYTGVEYMQDREAK